MKRLFLTLNYVVILVLALSTASCNSRTGKSSKSNVLLPSVTGAAYDVLVVGKREDWKSDAGRAIFDMLNEDMPGFPQSEPLFNISFTTENDFVSIFKPLRNIIMFDIDDEIYTQGSIKFLKDQWSTPQALVRITAPNRAELAQVVKERKNEIVNYLVEAEYSRAISFYTKYCNNDYRLNIERIFKASMIIPSHLDRSRFTNDFAWMNDGNLNITQNLAIYTYPCHCVDEFDLQTLIAKRDSFMKIYVKGPSEGSYMKTEQNFEPSYRRYKDAEGHEVAEVRGLWCMEGDAMGGPFVSRFFYDEKRDRAIVTEAFVYGPNQKKRNVFRQLDAMSYSLRIK